MLEIVVRAAICTLLLAAWIQLCLWALRLRHPKLLLAAWTAVLFASVAMPALQRVIPSAVPTLLSESFAPAAIVNPGLRAPRLSATAPAISPSGATAARALEPSRIFAWREWLTGGYVLVAAFLLFRLLLGLILSWRMLRATQPVGADLGCRQEAANRQQDRRTRHHRRQRAAAGGVPQLGSAPAPSRACARRRACGARRLLCPASVAA